MGTMARKGYQSMTISDNLVHRINKLIDLDNEDLCTKPKIIKTAISLLEKSRGKNETM